MHFVCKNVQTRYLHPNLSFCLEYCWSTIHQIADCKLQKLSYLLQLPDILLLRLITINNFIFDSTKEAFIIVIAIGAIIHRKVQSVSRPPSFTVNTEFIRFLLQLLENQKLLHHTNLPYRYYTKYFLATTHFHIFMSYITF